MKFIKRFSLILILIITIISGCEVQQSSYENTGVGGTIIDSSTRKPIQGVNVSLDGYNISTVTDSLGFYYLGELGVGSSAGNFSLTYVKDNYNTINSGNVILYAGDTTKRVNFSMYSPLNPVFTTYGLEVEEYIDENSFSAIDFYAMQVKVDYYYLTRDAFLRDSQNTHNNFRLITGYTGGWGFQTIFTGKLGVMTREEFQNLEKINVGPRPLEPSIDFPYEYTQGSFNYNSPINEVYGFYLKGKYEYGLRPRVYGVVRFAEIYFDNVKNIYIVKLDIKINRNGENYFLLN